MKRAVISAKNAAKARGKLPGNLSRILDDMLEAKISWQEILKQLVVRLSGNDEETWVRPNRRRLVWDEVYMPSKRGYATGEIVVAIDTSGSVSNEEMATFFAEWNSILTMCKPEQCYVLWCDAHVHDVDTITMHDDPDSIVAKRQKGYGGGGGTSFQPPFDWCKEQGIHPTSFIYMTDGYAPFPEEQPYDTIWLMTSSVEAPWGTNIKIDLGE
jgi:predicted metal-dependent peptidase